MAKNSRGGWGWRGRDHRRENRRKNTLTHDWWMRKISMDLGSLLQFGSEIPSAGSGF